MGMGEPTKVLFRKWNSGREIIALFPAIPGNTINRSNYCLSYEHLGQHGSACLDLSPHTTPTKPHEYADLKRELEAICYSLRVVKRMTVKHHRVRNSIQFAPK